jgi:membrane protein DedA with SNARE-associated domain
MVWLRIIGAILMVCGIVDISLYRFAHINFLGIAWSAYVFGLLGIFLAELGAEIPEEE